MAYKVFTIILTRDSNKTDQIFYLGDIYRKLNKTNETIMFFENITKKNPNNYAAYAEMALYYFDNNQTKEGEELFNKLKKIDLNPSHLVRGYNQIAVRYQERGYKSHADEMFDMSLKLRENYRNTITFQNYRKLYETVSKNGINLVVMQYPTLDTEELKSMFRSNEDIFFVSNEDNFKDALMDNDYSDIFIDRFAGTFGHTTKKGNLLIANNAAKAILTNLSIGD